MNKHIIKRNIPSLALICLLIAFMGYQSWANRPQTQNGPIATFDLERTFNNIDQQKAAIAAVPALADKLKADSDNERKALEQMKTELGLLQKGTPKYEELQDKLNMAAGMYQAHVEYGRMLIEAEKGRVIKHVYMDIRSAVKELAEAHNYAVVLVDDSVGEIPPGTVEDLNRQISARRVAYTSVDITDELIAHMNAAFKRAGGVVPPQTAAANTNPAPGKNP